MKLKSFFYPISKVHRVPKDEITYVVGNFRGLRGRFTIFENNSALLAFDERRIIGRFIESYIDDFKYSVKVNTPSDQLSMI